MESQNIEYKREIPKAKNMKAEIVSFLNNPAGGTIYLGVEDSGKLVHFDSVSSQEQAYKEWEEQLSNWISNAFRPDVTGLIHINPNETPFKIAISSGANKPYYYTDGEGINYKGIYIRSGSSKRLASDSEVRRMMNKNIANLFDSEKINNKKLNFLYVRTIFTNLEKNFDEVGLEFKRESNGKYNNAALIVSDENPFISKVAIYAGLNTLNFKDKKSFSGSIVRQIDEILNYIRLNNKINITIGSGGRRNESYSYPEVAVREAIVNAFVHRDYTMSSDIKVEMYNDRLSISSPGSLPDGLTVEDIKRGANAKRNPVLINALDKMNYIENYGSGVRRIFSLYKGFPRQPELIATHNLFTIVLYNKNYRLNLLELNSSLLEIVEYLGDGKLASRKEIQEALSLQKSYTSELIAVLKKNQVVTSEGRGSSTKYFLTEFE